jgi:dTDP-4-amino-4,6-dideoxygalactose transaminase
VALPTELANVRAVYHLYVVRVPDGRRDDLPRHLGAQGVATAIHYPGALPELAALAHLGHGPADFPVSSRFAGEILSLSLFPALRVEQIDRVADAIRRFFDA